MDLCVDIGATKTAVALLDDEGNLTEHKKFSTPKNFDDFRVALHKELKSVDFTLIKKAGIAAPGSHNKRGEMVYAPNLPWVHSSLATLLMPYYKTPILLLNDADAAGICEARIGTGKGYETVLYVTLSTGVGTAIVKQGKLIHRGSEGEAMWINGQMFEDLVSGPDIIRRFGKPGYELKDPAAWLEWSQDLAIGLFNMFTVFMPDVIVLGGGVSTHFSQFEAPLIEAFAKLNPGFYATPPIKQARYTEDAPLRGLHLALRS